MFWNDAALYRFERVRRDYRDLADGLQPEIVVTAVPYGAVSAWGGSAATGGAAAPLDSLASILQSGTVLAVASSKADRPRHDAYERVEQWQLGKRAFAILRRR